MPPQDQSTLNSPQIRTGHTWWIVGSLLLVLLVCISAVMFFGFYQKRPIQSSLDNQQATTTAPVPQWASLSSDTSGLYKFVNGQIYIYPGDSYAENMIAGADSATFEISTFDPHYAKDRNHVYYAGKIFSYYTDYNAMSSRDIKNDIDSLSFSLIPNSNIESGPARVAYVEDKNNVFSQIGNNFLLVSTSSATFQIIPDSNDLYAKDAQHVYIDSSIIPRANPTTFKLISAPNGSSTRMATDMYDIYCDGAPLSQGGWAHGSTTPIAEFDPATFNLFFDTYGAQTYYAKDKDHIYFIYEGDESCAISVVTGADQATFTPVFDATGHASAYPDFAYGKDNQNVFWESQTINADISSFILNPTMNTVGGFSWDAKDKNYRYYEGKIVQ